MGSSLRDGAGRRSAPLLLLGACSVVAAWNMLLDIDGSGTISNEEFLTAGRLIGFVGSLNRVSDGLDTECSNEVSLNELDPNFLFDATQSRCVVCTLPNPCSPRSSRRFLVQRVFRAGGAGESRGLRRVVLACGEAGTESWIRMHKVGFMEFLTD